LHHRKARTVDVPPPSYGRPVPAAAPSLSGEVRRVVCRGVPIMLAEFAGRWSWRPEVAHTAFGPFPTAAAALDAAGGLLGQMGYGGPPGDAEDE
jgi:hypothetical protein